MIIRYQLEWLLAAYSIYSKKCLKNIGGGAVLGDRRPIQLINKQKTKIQLVIKLLKEYRTALITNAAKGKIDVRQVPIP